MLLRCRADENMPYEKRGIDDRIKKLIEQLDDPRFANRENASLELAKIGKPALRSLAISVFEGSPESVWRTRKTLELIGTQGNEEVFYKSVGILQLLFSDSGDSLRPKIFQLQQQWKLEQKKNIIKCLVEHGAAVSDPRSSQPAFNDEFGQVVFGNNIIVNRQFEAFEFDPVSGTTTETAIPRSQGRNQRLQRRIDMDSEQAIKQIDEILIAPVDDNRELVLGNQSTPPAESTASPQQLQRQQAIQRLQNQIALDNMVQRQFINRTSASGVTVTLGDQWNGTTADLQQLRNLVGLSRIELIGVDPGPDQMRQLAELPFQLTYKIDGDQIKDRDLALLGNLPGLRAIEFADREITPELLAEFSDSEMLLSVTFSNCKLSAESLLQLRTIPTLGAIYFNDMQIDSSIFKSLEKLTNLNYLSLSICKFETSAYRRLELVKPNLQIAFTPQAFLGVRGPMNLSAIEGCEVSEVIPESGAAKAGLVVGDVIEQVNGQPIEKFEDLRLHIAQHRSGEALNVVVRRDGKPVELKVVLGKYDRNLERADSVAARPALYLRTPRAGGMTGIPLVSSIPRMPTNKNSSR